MSSVSEIETAQAYDFWCAVWALTTAVGRRVYVDRPRAPVYLNWYIVLVAESGITRKTTAVNIARDITLPLLEKESVIVEGSITPDKLKQDMSYLSIETGTAHATFCIPEMVTVFGKDRHSMSLPGVLTDLYDCPSRRTGGGTLSRSGSDLHNVFVSLLSASTPSWLLRAINPDIIEGGFTSRTIFVMAATPKRRVAWPSDNDSDQAIRANLRQRLVGLREDAAARQKISIVPNALRRFRKWYNARELSQDAYVGSFQSREDAHILNLAAVLCINDGSWVIEVAHVSIAIKIITEVRDKAAALFTGIANPSDLLVAVNKVRDALQQAGIEGIRQTDLQNRMRRYIKTPDLANLLDIMHELGMVKKLQVHATAKAKRARIMWIAADLFDAEKMRALQETIL